MRESILFEFFGSFWTWVHPCLVFSSTSLVYVYSWVGHIDQLKLFGGSIDSHVLSMDTVVHIWDLTRINLPTYLPTWTGNNWALKSSRVTHTCWIGMILSNLGSENNITIIHHNTSVCCMRLLRPRHSHWCKGRTTPMMTPAIPAQSHHPPAHPPASLYIFSAVDLGTYGG